MLVRKVASGEDVRLGLVTTGYSKAHVVREENLAFKLDLVFLF